MPSRHAAMPTTQPAPSRLQAFARLVSRIAPALALAALAATTPGAAADEGPKRAAHLGSLDDDGAPAGVRFLVDADGMRQIGAKELGALGVALPVDAKRIRLFDHRGEVPILVDDGNDGALDADSDDRVLFYASFPRGEHTERPPYNDAAPHWLIVDGEAADRFAESRGALEPQKRLEAVSGEESAKRFPEPVRYDCQMATTRFERDFMYATWLDADVETTDFYFLGNVGATRPDVEFEFWAPRPVDAKRAGPLYESGFDPKLTIKLYGISRAKTEGQNDHVVDIALNGHALGRAAWDGVEPLEWSAPVDLSQVAVGGPQKLTLTVPEDRLFTVDEMYVDWAELAVPTSLAGSTELSPTSWNDSDGHGFHLVCVKRPTPEERLLDPVGGKLYAPSFQQAQDEAGALHRLEFRVGAIDPEEAARQGRGPARYVLFGEADVAPVDAAALRPWRPLPELSNPAALAVAPASVIVTNGVLWEPASRLANRRQAEGLDTLLVDVYDVYDHYSNGLVSEEAVFLFLKTLFEASPLDPKAPGAEEEPADGAPRPKNYQQAMRKLRYLTLFGDSTYDYKGVQAKYHPERQIADANLLPISYTDTRQARRMNRSMFPADNNYAALRGEDHVMPVVAVGRVPAATVEEANAYLEKVEEYEAMSADDAWAGRSLLVSSWERSFKGLLDRLAENSLLGFHNKFLVAELDSYENDVFNLSDALNEGCGVLYYVGHGGSFVWRVGPIDMEKQKDLFTGANVRELSNEGRYPIVFVSSCYTVSFDHARSLGEEFVLTPRKGAVAVMGSPWKTGVTPNHNFNEAAAGYMFSPEKRAEMFPPPPNPDVVRLGDAFLATKLLRSTDHQSRVNFTLLGDPCLRVHVPPAPPKAEAAAEEPSASADASGAAPAPADALESESVPPPLPG